MVRNRKSNPILAAIFITFVMTFIVSIFIIIKVSATDYTDTSGNRVEGTIVDSRIFATTTINNETTYTLYIDVEYYFNEEIKTCITVSASLKVKMGLIFAMFLS